MSKELNIVSDSAFIVFDKNDVDQKKTSDGILVDVYNAARLFIGRFRNSFSKKIYPSITPETIVTAIPLYINVLGYVAAPIFIDPSLLFFEIDPRPSPPNITIFISLNYLSKGMPVSLTEPFQIQNLNTISNPVKVPIPYLKNNEVLVDFFSVSVSLSVFNPETNQNELNSPSGIYTILSENVDFNTQQCTVPVFINFYASQIQNAFLSNTNDKNSRAPENPNNVTTSGVFIGSFEVYFRSVLNPSTNVQRRPYKVGVAPQKANPPTLTSRLPGYNLISGTIVNTRTF